TPDTFAVAPAKLAETVKSVTLFVYLHGMAQDCMEAFNYPKPVSYADLIIMGRPDALVLSSNYRQRAWVRDEALADITQNIHEVMQEYPVRNIVLVGSSMGGCAVLVYACMAPDDIRSKITGIVSVEGAGDLAKLHDQTHVDLVRGILEKCFGGAPQ